MNVMLQRHAAKFIYVVPEGLRELMTDISREVLREQPENMYLFIADYLEALLLTRENARVAARLVQSITEIAEATLDFLYRAGMDRPEADKIVAIIQETFRKRIRDEPVAISHELHEDIEEANIITDILHEADIGTEQAEQAAKIIQLAYRRFKQRKEAEKQLLSGMIDWRVAARSAIRLYRQTGVTTEEANRAATLIKAAYKGYYTRRIMQKLADEQRLQELGMEEEMGEGEEEELEEKTEMTEEEALDYKQLFKDDDRMVKIDYDTVIPHVDFGDVTDTDSPGAVITYAMDNVIDNVMRKVGYPGEAKYKKRGPCKKPQKKTTGKPSGHSVDVKKSKLSGPPSAKTSKAGPPSAKASAAGPPSAKSSKAGPPSAKASAAGPPSAKSSKAGPPSAKASAAGPPSAKASAAGPPSTKASAAGPPSTKASEVGPPSTKASETQPSEPPSEPVTDVPSAEVEEIPLASETGEPEGEEPETTEPEAGEPETGEPEAGEPDAGEPVAAEELQQVTPEGEDTVEKPEEAVEDAAPAPESTEEQQEVSAEATTEDEAAAE